MLRVIVSVGGPEGANALLKGAGLGFGCSRSALSTLVNAIATPPTATSATAAATPNTDTGRRCRGLTSSGTAGSERKVGLKSAGPYGFGETPGEPSGEL